MPSDIPQTSRDAHAKAVASKHTHDLRVRIAKELDGRPASARQVAARVDESYHDVERACSWLHKHRIVERTGLTRNPESGRQAYRLKLTGRGRKWLSDGVVPEADVTLRDHELSVINAANQVRATWKNKIQVRGDALPIEVLRDLEFLDRVLDGYWHQKRRLNEEAAALRVTDPDSPERRIHAKRGQWLRSDGTPINVQEMHDRHVVAARQVLQEAGITSGPVWGLVDGEAQHRGLIRSPRME